MTDKDFTASNGWTVSPPDSLGDLNIYSSKGVLLDYISSDSVGPLREYFQAERDKELGRWRDPENKDMVAYRTPEEDDEDGRCVLVLNETTGATSYEWERLHYSRSARRYFAAHPDGGTPQAAAAILQITATLKGDRS